MVRGPHRRPVRDLFLIVVALSACGGGDRTGVVSADTAFQDTTDLSGADTVADAVDSTEAEDTAPLEDTATPADTATSEDTLTQLAATGDPCEEHEDCRSGLCALGRDGRVCVDPCGVDGACPEGLFCAEIQGPKTEVRVCVPANTTACAPCLGDEDCAPRGEPAACVSLGDIGSYCLLDCGDADGCPGDGLCDDGHCIPSGGVCGCTPYAILTGAETDCFVAGADGRCEGMRGCGPEGLSACDAPAPATETCDGADEDCDGDTDEGTCDDGDPCTADGCDPETGCTHTGATGGSCDDESLCTTDDTCGAEGCGGTAVDCDDDDPCTADSCDPATGCVHTPSSGATCDDLSDCTTGDTCDDGECVGGDVDCDDLDPCTADSCDPTSGCTHEASSGAACEDGNACTQEGQCFGGICVGGAAVDCDDGNPCTSLACDVQTGCTYAHLSGSCDDGDPCTVSATCVAGACEASVTDDCDDDNPCTSDQCVPGFGCVNAPTGGGCDDGDPCTFDEACVVTTCTPQTSVSCDDGNPCTIDSCTPDRGCAYVAAGLSCVDDPAYADFCEQVGVEGFVEPNDDFDSAALAKSGRTYTGDITPVDDDDYLVLWTCGERIIRVTLDNLPATSSAVDYQIDFYLSGQGKRHSIIDSNGGTGTTHEKLNAYVGEAGPAWVAVHDYLHNDADADKPYHITLESLPVPDADLEPNDHLETATVLVSGEVVTAYIASLDDHDVYAVEVPGERIVRARVDNAAVNGTATDFQMDFRDEAGVRTIQWIDSNGGTGATHRDVNVYVGEAGTLYLDLHDYLNDDWDYDIPYTVSLEVLEVPDAALEPNGNSNFTGNALLATPIDDNGTIAACIASVEDEDWFAVEVPGERIISLSVSNAPATGSAVDYQVEVYNAAGGRLNQVIDSNGSSGTSVVAYNAYAVEAGTYYVKVEDYLDNDWDIDHCYTITTSILPVPDVDDEPNDDPALATPLTPGGTHTAYVASLDDQDFYAFDVAGERVVVMSVTAPAGGTDPQVDLYGTGSSKILSMIDSNGASGPTSMTRAAYLPEAGSYALEVHDYLNNSFGYAQPYTVGVTLHPVPDAALEPNDTRATATPLTLGSPVVGYHANDEDQDWWSFTAPASGAVTVTLTTAETTSVGYTVRLYSEGGSSLETKIDTDGTDALTAITFSAAVAAGTTCTVRVDDYLGDDFDLDTPYTLTVSAQ